MTAYRYKCNCCNFIQVVNIRKKVKPKKKIKGFCAKSKTPGRVNFTLVEDK